MLRTLCVFALLTLAVHVAWAGDTTPNTGQSTTTTTTTSSSSAAVVSESEQLGRTRVMEMANFLAAAEKFSFSLRAGFDVVQDNGQKIEFGEIREITVQRPDRVRIEELASDGARDVMVFDGKNISILNGEKKVFAQAPQPGDIDTTVLYFVRDLQMRLPLAPLLMRHFPRELERRMQSIDAVEQTDILGQPALHLAGRTATVDFQVWIAEGKQPLPLRIILSYREIEGHPQFWANFSKWDLTPEINKTSFIFAAPADATQIMFAAQFQVPASGPQNDQTQNQGGKQ